MRPNLYQVLLRDATTLLLHFSLILPVQIDRVFFTTIVRQVDKNLVCLVVFHISHELPYT